jgi:hypothetical protein
MAFRRKKKELEDLGLAEEEIIDFKEFEEFDEKAGKEKGVKPEEIEKTFIFHISNGCPICGSDVKGNDYYRYFCEECNVLFDKKDIIEKEFGKSIRETAIRKTRLSDAEKEELEKKRKELKERIYRTFTKEEKKELAEEAEQRKEEEAEEPEEVEEVEAEVIPPTRPALEALAEEPEEETEEPEEEAHEEAEEPEAEEPEEVEEPETEEPEEVEPEEPETEEPAEKEEYELESPDKVIASKESDKMHKGDCHFVKKIHPKNRIYLNSIEEGEEQGKDLCVCLRRLRAMQR